jgi:hypothetical protein
MNFLKFFPRNFLANLTIAEEVHKAVIGTIMKVLEVPEKDTELLMLELCITTATGIWLEEWGSWFGVTRKLGESDSEYSTRILSSIQAPKSTLPALEKNISEYLSSKTGKDYTPEDIHIFEPYTRLKTFSHRGGFSSDYHFPDGTYWRRNVIDITLPESLDDKLISLVNSIRAAGIKVAFTISSMGGIVCHFADDSTYTTEYEKTLLLEYPLIKMNEGAIRDVNTAPSSRKRSGKKSIYRVESVLLHEVERIMAGRIAGDSYFYDILKRAYKPILVQIGTKDNPEQTFSKERGYLSGGVPPHSEYAEVPVLPPDDLIDYTLGFKRVVASYRPKAFSSTFSKFGKSTPLSGIYNEPWNGKEDGVNVKSAVFGSYNIIPTEEKLIVKNKYLNTAVVDTKRGEFSGRKSLWVDRTTVVTELFDFSPYRFDVVSPSVNPEDVGSYMTLQVNSLRYIQAQSNALQTIQTELGSSYAVNDQSEVQITVSTD